MTRKDFLSLPAAALARPDRTPPNVLLIISDQFHHGALSAAGHPVVKTPNLDRLAREGVRFTNAVCPTPFCSPSRATIMTGLYPHRHRITFNVGDPDRGLDPKLPTTDNTLYEAGYTCVQRGKWHLGDKTRLAPYAKDEDPDYREGKRRQFVATDAVKRALAQFDDRSIQIGRVLIPPKQSPESQITDSAIRKLESIAAKPFFLTVSLPAPHAPWIVADPYYSMYDRARIPLPANRNSVEPVDRNSAAWRFGRLLGDEGFREYLGAYWGMVSMVDWNIGRLLDALRRLRVENDTLVIFVADHGDMQAGHSMYGKSNFCIYEETTRVPMIVRLPGRVPAGKVVRTQSSLADLHPTILDYAGFAAPQGIHGRSLRPHIEGREDLTRPVFIERERGPRNFQRTIRTIEWKYVYCSSGESQLYNLGKDPGETRNLLADSTAAPVRKKLHADLACWMRDTADPRATAMPASI
jgi:arylsulfatase A-like enzyme